MFLIKIWRGETGALRTFRIALTNADIPENRPGIYMMVRRRFVFFFKTLYIGKAADLRERVIGHERWPEAWLLGATERHWMGVESEDDRLHIEEDLIRRYRPLLNDQLVPRSENDAPVHWRRRRGWFG
jgi:excinuclease UvrABC nuclease subunit